MKTIPKKLSAEERDRDRLAFAYFLNKRIPFSIVRFGDGNFEAMVRYERGKSCDNDEYTAERQIGELAAYQFLSQGTTPNAHISCWIPDYLGLDQDVMWPKARIMDHDTLLLHPEWMSSSLKNFYRALTQSSQRKIFIGPKELSGAVDLLNLQRHIVCPRPNAFAAHESIKKQAWTEQEGIFVICAGGLATTISSDILCRYPDMTVINLGSALDPIFIGHTRTGQMTREEAIHFFETLYDE